jgi:uncharacterized protein
LALGAASGVLAGLLGIGGGAVMVPFIAWLLERRGVDPSLAVKLAIATAMATVLFTSISSLRAHWKHGSVRWDLFKGLAPGIVAGSLIASLGVFVLLKGKVLALLFAGFLAFSATQMAFGRQPKAGRVLPGAAGRFSVGVGAGFLSGLVGAGGGFLLVPFLRWCNVPMQQVVGTSAALGLPIALVNSLGYVAGGWHQAASVQSALGFVWLPGLLVLASASVLTAPMGARMAHRMDVVHLRRIFAVLLYALAGYMLWRGIS